MPFPPPLPRAHCDADGRGATVPATWPKPEGPAARPSLSLIAPPPQLRWPQVPQTPSGEAVSGLLGPQPSKVVRSLAWGTEVEGQGMLEGKEGDVP